MKLPKGNLADRRLVRRLMRLADAAERTPSASLPQRAGAIAALGADVQIFRKRKGNSRSTLLSLMWERQLKGAAAEPEVYVIHDTTEFRFRGDDHREGLGGSVPTTSRVS